MRGMSFLNAQHKSNIVDGTDPNKEPHAWNSYTKPARQDDRVLEGQWQAVDDLRNSMDADQYKHVVLGIIFLRSVSDSFNRQHAKIESDMRADPEERGPYASENIPWIPRNARWQYIRSQSRSPSIGKILDNAMTAIGQENPPLRNALPRPYAGISVDSSVLGHLVDLFDNIPISSTAPRLADALGQIYEYFLFRFASSGGRRGGRFYTPCSVARLLVEMLEPRGGTIYDPCCGPAGMLVQLIEFMQSHATNSQSGIRGTIRVHGQESDRATWQLAMMNLAMREIKFNVMSGDSIHDDQHQDLRADFILADPPFNASGWGRDRLLDDRRWKYGIPPDGNANFAWVQHIIHHLSDTGRAGLVLANNSMSSNYPGDADVRKNLVVENLVDCVVALPGQLFYSTQMPACLWFLSRNRADCQYSARHGNILFIDARMMGHMIDRVHRVLDTADICRVTRTYHAWRADSKDRYVDVPGFCKSATLEEIRKHNYVLVPGRHVGTGIPSDTASFEDDMSRLISQWNKQQLEAEKMNMAINRNMKNLGFGAAGDGA